MLSPALRLSWSSCFPYLFVRSARALRALSAWAAVVLEREVQMGDKRDDNPFLSALREERALELEGDRISGRTARLISERRDARASGDTDRVAQLDTEIRILIDRRQAL